MGFAIKYTFNWNFVAALSSVCDQTMLNKCMQLHLKTENYTSNRKIRNTICFTKANELFHINLFLENILVENPHKKEIF